MEPQSLMSGIAVVIDDEIENVATDGDNEDGNGDLIVEIVKQLKQEWNLPFYTAKQIPPEETWPNLLQAASFILLDWRLWPSNVSQLEEEGVARNIQFLKQAKDYFVPVFIFTNEASEDVEDKLHQDIYQKESPERNFIFLKRKADLFADNALDFSAIEKWIKQNASVYALKTWEQEFHAAKKELFGAMYARSPDWPKVFWKAYKDDSVDPSSSLTHLINESLWGRMRTSAFEAEILDTPYADVRREDLLALIGETSFRAQNNLPEDEIRCGDLFKQSKGKFLLNLRPDCDCIPRDGNADEMELYCVEGKKMSNSELRKLYHEGHFPERVWEGIAFSIYNGGSVRFDFRKIRIEKFAELRAYTKIDFLLINRSWQPTLPSPIDSQPNPNCRPVEIIFV